MTGLRTKVADETNRKLYMCGISGLFGQPWSRSQLDAMVRVQAHRGPDASGTYVDPSGVASLGHNRLSIIDLTDAGLQPMASVDGRHWIAFNGEIYNYLELRAELSDYPFQSHTDTEVVLAAYQRWGEACLDRFLGMFAFLIWDVSEQRLFAARDRFGVKPLYYYCQPNGALAVASEIKALHDAGVPAEPDPRTWSTYLSQGYYEHSAQTFWADVRSLPAGHCLNWRDGRLRIRRWYDLAGRVGFEFDRRSAAEVGEEYLALLRDSVRLRFRSDVPVGVNLSGGLDSSTLLGAMRLIHGSDSQVKIFTFATGDPEYDELPWVQQMLAGTHHPWSVSYLRPDEVPRLAEEISAAQDEPFGGLPTLAYARLFERAREEGVIVLLDGQGMDEAWAGYDYYEASMNGTRTAGISTVQGTRESATRPGCLTAEFRELASAFQAPEPFPDALRNVQFRDACHTKIPRALRFNDRISMWASTELREPFLDHRLFELAFRQPPEHKRRGQTGKWLLRQITKEMMPAGLREAPKRPVQTPQREWLRGELREWANDCIEGALDQWGGVWFKPDAVRESWNQFLRHESDNSFYVWQWISAGLSTN